MAFLDGIRQSQRRLELFKPRAGFLILIWALFAEPLSAPHPIQHSQLSDEFDYEFRDPRKTSPPLWYAPGDSDPNQLPRKKRGRPTKAKTEARRQAAAWEGDATVADTSGRTITTVATQLTVTALPGKITTPGITEARLTHLERL